MATFRESLVCCAPFYQNQTDLTTKRCCETKDNDYWERNPYTHTHTLHIFPKRETAKNNQDSKGHHTGLQTVLRAPGCCYWTTKMAHVKEDGYLFDNDEETLQLRVQYSALATVRATRNKKSPELVSYET